MELKRPVLLCILDGWGYRQDVEHNAIALAKTPNWDRFMQENLTNNVRTSGADVGLPDGQMGNSEVGHMNLGAGRVVLQDLPRITKAAEEGEFDVNPAVVSLIQKTKASKGAIHLFVMLSDGGVHNHMDHGKVLAEHLAKQGLEVIIHGIMDGRDVPPSSGLEFARSFSEALKPYENIRFGSIVGRYFIMDRDNRWERVSQSYFAAAHAKAEYSATNAVQAIQQAYDRGETDEFVKATLIDGYEGMKDGDSLIFTNFRADRAREILRALLKDDFDGFERPHQLNFAAKVGFVEYSDDLAPLMETMFYAPEMKNFLGEIVSRRGLKQFRTAETEKYPHVTFFFNGGKETPYEGEDRHVIPSPKVATYDLQPEMSAYEVCDTLVNAIESQKYDLIVANFANGDMVGHTGVEEAAIKAAEAVDQCLGRIEQAILKVDGTAFVTADHGNAEEMWDYTTNGPHTAHTTNLVKGTLINPPSNIVGLNDAKLGDIAPALLELLGIEKPEDMTGQSFLKKRV